MQMKMMSLLKSQVQKKHSEKIVELQLFSGIQNKMKLDTIEDINEAREMIGIY